MESAKNIQKLISEAFAIEQEEAKEAGRIGFMARALVQATLPHSKHEGNEFERINGNFKLSILSPAKIGLPYGSIPRLLISWLTTEAVRTQQREIVLGHTLSEFMEQLGLIPTGGRWGTITRLREQMKRLFASSISCTYDNGDNWSIKNVQPVSNAMLWWDPKKPMQAALFESTVTLGEDFFTEVVNHPVPIDMGALKALKKSPLALDIYCWLTYRMSYLKQNSTVGWLGLQTQFGADYALDTQGIRNFKKAFLRELKKVCLFYPTAKLNITNEGLTLIPSKPHIKKMLRG
jgi:hypothetical protein